MALLLVSPQFEASKFSVEMALPSVPKEFFKKLTPHEYQILERKLLVIYGAVWGDEGKGKTLIEYLDICNDIGCPVGLIVKSNGGANSGHTAEGLSHNLIPSGIKNLDMLFALASGVVADPRKLLWEIAYLKANEVDIYKPSRLILDYNLETSDITDRFLDLAEDIDYERRTGKKRGSTGRGIKYAFARAPMHEQICYNIFSEERYYGKYHREMQTRLEGALDICRGKLKITEEQFEKIFSDLTRREQGTSEKPGPNAGALRADLITLDELDFTRYLKKGYSLDFERIIQESWEAGRKLAPLLGSVSDLVMSTIDRGRAVICEAGQGSKLNVKGAGAPRDGATSSCVLPGGIYASLQIAPDRYPLISIETNKAYSTCVGTHHNITALPAGHPLLLLLGPKEKGVTTGRQRDVGWFDAVAAGVTAARAGATFFPINKLDELSHRTESMKIELEDKSVITKDVTWDGNISICVAYKDKDGKIIYDAPHNDEDWEQCTPVYVEVPGWKEDITNIKNYEDLPENAKLCIAVICAATANIAEKAGMKERDMFSVPYVGNGPKRGQRIENVHSIDRLLKQGRDYLSTAKLIAA